MVCVDRRCRGERAIRRCVCVCVWAEVVVDSAVEFSEFLNDREKE